MGTSIYIIVFFNLKIILSIYVKQEDGKGEWVNG